MHYACAAGHEEVVKILLDGGADPNATDGEGRSPLTYALHKGHEQTAFLLSQAIGK